MIGQGVRFAFAAVLAIAAIGKLASPDSSRAALGTFGIRGPRLRWTAWIALIVAELALAVGVGAGVDAAAYAAALLMTAFALALLAALRAGRAGAPCACFGSRSKVAPNAVARNFGLALGFAALPLLPPAELSTDEWLGLGLAAALLACAGLAIAAAAALGEAELSSRRPRRGRPAGR